MTKEEKKKKKKGSRVMTDYYQTNREYAKENERRQREEGTSKKWTKGEIGMVLIIVIAAVGVFVKYVILR